VAIAGDGLTIVVDGWVVAVDGPTTVWKIFEALPTDFLLS